MVTLSLLVQPSAASRRLQSELVPQIRADGTYLTSLDGFHGKMHTITH
jgi:hypothetical protein